MATLVSSKYSLKSLHEDIGLLDRKLAHLHKYEVFAHDSDREAAAARIEHKRELLVRQARTMVEEGIEFHASDVPQSLRDSSAPDATEESTAVLLEAPVTISARKAVKPATQFSGTALDADRNLQQYREKKAKPRSAAHAPLAMAEVATAS